MNANDRRRRVTGLRVLRCAGRRKTKEEEEDTERKRGAGITE